MAAGNCLHEAIAHRAVVAPDATAVICGETRLTYAGLLLEADVVGRALRHRGAGPGDLVGVYLSRSAALIPGMLGILRCGAGYLPIDPEYPASRVAFMLADAGVRLVLTEPSLLGSLPAQVEGVLMGDLHLTAGPGELPGDLAGHPAAVRARPEDVEGVLMGDLHLTAGPGELPGDLTGHPAAVRARPEDVAYVIYTSGSTGTPKGVVVENRNVMALLETAVPLLGLSSADVWSAFHSCAFDFSVWEIWGALVSGAAVVLVPREIARVPEAFSELLRRERVSVLSQTPSAFWGLSREFVARNDSTGVSALRVIVFGGEALDVTSLATWIDVFGDSRPRIYNMYGITETTVHATIRRITRDDLYAQAASPIGRALPHLHLHVLDEAMEPVKTGEVGEIYVGGTGVARGYLKRPGLTAERFLEDPCDPAGRVYRSGDLARLLDDGELDYVGRRDHQVKIRGYRVELGEVEAAISSHPGVQAAAVDARPGPAGDVRMIACFVPAGAGAAESDLRRHLERILPSHMIPGSFTALQALPLTINGKLDRTALPDPVMPAPAPPSAVTPGPDQGSADTVSKLTGLWRQFLGSSEPDGNFFDLGGDSLLAIEFASQAKEAGIDLQLSDIFDHGSLADTVTAVISRQERATPAGEPASDPQPAGPAAGDAYPLSALQLGMMYEARSHSSQPRYFVVSSAHLAGLAGLDEVSVHRAAVALAERHAVLRTSCDLSGSQPLQVVHSATGVLVRYLDLSSLDPARARARVAAERAAEELDYPSMTRAPGWRLVVLRTGEADAHVFLSHWHWLLDGWSVARLLAELAILLGAPGSLAEPGPAFGDYIAVEQAAHHDEAAREYWRVLLSRHAAPELPAPRSSASWQAPIRIRSDITDISDDLRALARDQLVPLRTLFLASHLAVLRAICGADAYAINIMDGRIDAIGADRSVGLFLHPVPAGLAKSPASWADMISQTYAAEREAWPHRRFPVRLMSLAGTTGPPPVRTCFTYLDLARASGVDDLAETVRTGIPLLVDACPAWIEVEADPSMTALDPADVAARHRLALEAMARHPDSPPGMPSYVGLMPEVPSAPDLLSELLRAWSAVLGRPALTPDANVRDLGCSSLDVLRAACLLESALGSKVPVEIIRMNPILSEAARALAVWYSRPRYPAGLDQVMPRAGAAPCSVSQPGQGGPASPST